MIKNNILENQQYKFKTLLYSALNWIYIMYGSCDIYNLKEWLLLDAKWATFQPYNDENKFHSMKWWWGPSSTRLNYGHLVQQLPYQQKPSFFTTIMIRITSSWISCQLRDIYSKCICCWNVATNKWKIHNLKVKNHFFCLIVS